MRTEFTTPIEMPFEHVEFLDLTNAELRRLHEVLLDTLAHDVNADRDAVIRGIAEAGITDIWERAVELVKRARQWPALAEAAAEDARDAFAQALHLHVSTRTLHRELKAAETALATDPSDEGLFLSREGAFVVETTRRNIAWIADGNLRYPDPSLGSVAGTCLAWLLDLGLPAEPTRGTFDDLLAADAIVVMNAVRGVAPVQLLCDANDVPQRSGIDSHEHPIVSSLCRQWIEALESTVETKTPPAP